MRLVSPTALLLLAPLAFTCAPISVAAQDGPAEPRASSPWLRIGGEASAQWAPEDYGFFNDTSYEHNALRLLRLGLSAAVRPDAPVSLLAEVRSENADEPRFYALLVRFRPTRRWPIDLQAGLVPPVFGAYPGQRYARSGPFLATPIAYQYLTTLRADSAPGNATDLLRVRGSGWLLRHPLGSSTLAAGLPLIDAQQNDAGLEARYRGDAVEAAIAWTHGSLCRPRAGLRDDNDGAQISSRVAWRPHPGLVIGASQARGEWLERNVQRLLRPYGTGPGRQTVWGADAEASAGYWLARAEVVWSGWSGLPVGPGEAERVVRARALTLETRFRIRAGVTAGLRGEHLGFDRVQATEGALTSWDAPVTRLEGGVSYSPVRHLLVKAGYQRNWRDAGRVRRSGLLGVQVLAWF